MAKNTEHSLKDPEIWIDIWHGKKPRQFRAWRYYGIVDALRSLGVDQERAYELGKWAQQARDGDTETAMTLMDVEIKLRAVLK